MTPMCVDTTYAGFLVSVRSLLQHMQLQEGVGLSLFRPATLLLQESDNCFYRLPA